MAVFPLYQMTQCGEPAVGSLTLAKSWFWRWSPCERLHARPSDGTLIIASMSVSPMANGEEYDASDTKRGRTLGHAL